MNDIKNLFIFKFKNQKFKSKLIYSYSAIISTFIQRTFLIPHFARK